MSVRCERFSCFCFLYKIENVQQIHKESHRRVVPIFLPHSLLLQFRLSAPLSRFMPRVEIVQKHNTAARRLYIRGHNGKIYPYLVMNDACLTESRREERVLQLLRLLNPCLEKRKETTKRHLFFTGRPRHKDEISPHELVFHPIRNSLSHLLYAGEKFGVSLSLHSSSLSVSQHHHTQFEFAFKGYFLSCQPLVVCLRPDVCPLSIYALDWFV